MTSLKACFHPSSFNQATQMQRKSNATSNPKGSEWTPVEHALCAKHLVTKAHSMLALVTEALLYLQKVLFWVTEPGTRNFSESNIDTWPVMQIRNPIWFDSLDRNNWSTSQRERKQSRERHGWGGTFQCCRSLATSFLTCSISS